MRKNRLLVSILSFALCLSLSESAFAALKKKGGKSAFAGGGFSVGLCLGLMTADQSGLNTMIGVAKNSATTAGTSNFSSGMEYMAHFTFRFSNDFVALQLRPSIFQQSTSGSGTDGSYSYDLKGYTIFFPLVRLIPLSNDIIDFYLQGGIGYGVLNGSITTGPTKADFKGANFGMQVGLGADFCFFPEHCFGIEGNYRYLPIERNIVGSNTGTVVGSTQSAAGRELEDLNGSDVGTSLTGISGMLTYSYNF